MIEIIDGRLELPEDIAKKVKPGSRAQKFIDNEVLRRCAPMVPFEGGFLTQSGIEYTDPGSGRVIYKIPYARRWYYRPANFRGAPRRGNYWFERMKKEGGAQAILKGVKAFL